MFSLFLFITLAVVVHSKREVDSPRTPSIHGGGKVRKTNRGLVRSDARDGLSLLDVTGVQAGGEERESFSFLREAKYAECYANDIEGQGLKCNSCWAFAVQKMMQARRCKHRVDHPETVREGEKPLVQLSPLNMICHMQTSENGESICEAKNIYDALSFAEETGVVESLWIARWRYLCM